MILIKIREIITLIIDSLKLKIQLDNLEADIKNNIAIYNRNNKNLELSSKNQKLKIATLIIGIIFNISLVTISLFLK